jgi:adenine-specific DNA-methyltransferase
MDKDQLRAALNKTYGRDRWRSIVRQVFSHVALYEPQEIPCRHDAVKGFLQIGDVRLEDGKNLALFEIKLSEKIQLLRNRVTLRNIVARHIDQAANHGVLVIFDSRSDDYRFTFAARETEFDEEGNLLEKETATRRYTYVLGPNESCRTAADRFYALIQKRDQVSLDDVHEAFSVEKLNKEFFDAYQQHYQRFTEYLIASDYRENLFHVGRIKDDKERTAAEKPIRDFAKRLLGCIVFLHFLQKKGWLGCPAKSTDWTGGNPNFMDDLFGNAEDRAQFHATCLMPLFHGALNTPGRPNDVFELTGTRILYLNGGLFERHDPDVSAIDFPEEFFHNLLDFFGRYNFTIDENDPDDHEVGIDPEMLGHIFENLLEDNKDKGAYYTPKAIVQYMCQESLIQYLKTHLGDHIELENLVRFKTRGDETDKNNFIVRNARQIEELLDMVRI